MAEYVRRYVPCRNPLCWNVVFVWDGPDCSHSCRQAWCRANGRNTVGEPHESVTIVHKPGEIVMTITPDLSGYEQRMKDALRESRIVHAAGVIPPEVEQAVTAQIQQRAWQAATGWSTTERPEPIEVTREQWEWLKARYAAPLDYGIHNGIGALTGISVKIVEPDPTPEPGWLKRLLRRLFG